MPPATTPRRCRGTTRNGTRCSLTSASTLVNWCPPRPFVGPKGAFIPAFPSPCRRKGNLMELAMGFSPCLSRKRPSHGFGVRLRWFFPPACRGKGCIMDLVCAYDGLSPLPVKEKAASWTWCTCGQLCQEAPGGPTKCPGSPRGQNMQLMVTNVVLKW